MGAFYRIVFLFALIGSPAFALDSDNKDDKNRPVTKVINLLKDMQKQLEQQGLEDEEIFNKFACWCTTNEALKTKAIADAESKIEQLTGKIERSLALTQRLESEIKDHEETITAGQKSLDQAVAIRQKELAGFNEQEKDLLDAISALKSAIEVLKKHQGGSFLQVQNRRIQGIAASIENTMNRHVDMLAGVLTKKQRNMVEAFVQAAGPGYNSYASQSGEIFGILQQMLDGFQAELKSSQGSESGNVNSFQDLKASKEEEVSTNQEKLEHKTGNLARNNQERAEDEEELEDTKEQLEADKAFLADLKKKCAAMDSEFAMRQKTRNQEVAAVAKALEFLSSDEAHDLFSSTFNSFIQKKTSVETTRRNEAAKLLSNAAAKSGNPRLSAIAMSAKLDAFKKVKEMIGNMLKDLNQQQEDEVKEKHYCVDQKNEYAVQTEAQERTKAELEIKIANLEGRIKTAGEDIDRAAKENANGEEQKTRASENRAKENQAYQAEVKDQISTQRLLTGALNALKSFYEQKPAASFAQQAPPASFEPYQNNKKSGGVIAMIESVIADAKEAQAESTKVESDAQTTYEDFMKDSNLSIDANNKLMVDRRSTKGDLEVQHTDRNSDHDGSVAELALLAETANRLEERCGFIVKNFDLTQSARTDEMNALKQAMQILSGATFSQFLQRV